MLLRDAARGAARPAREPVAARPARRAADDRAAAQPAPAVFPAGRDGARAAGFHDGDVRCVRRRARCGADLQRVPVHGERAGAAAGGVV